MHSKIKANYFRSDLVGLGWGKYIVVGTGVLSETWYNTFYFYYFSGTRFGELFWSVTHRPLGLSTLNNHDAIPCPLLYWLFQIHRSLYAAPYQTIHQNRTFSAKPMLVGT